MGCGECLSIVVPVLAIIGVCFAFVGFVFWLGARPDRWDRG
jgi:hypothetical protein